ncbi:MAG: gliding motility-associated C-terminal domain-containing protein [Bacteroidales bacterium]|nr:gliding motility-associated C-terminal domain-containing protein [Bacteroidales bacterium]
MKKIYLILGFVFYASFVFPQVFTNSGAKISIAHGAYVSIGDFENQTAGADGKIFLDGTLLISGDFSNSSSGNLFADIESVPDGNLILTGQGKIIEGQTPIYFENVSISDDRTLENDLNSIFGILSLNGIIDLNSNSLIIANNSADAIDYKSGFIISETSEAVGFGIIKWEIAENLGVYQIPFGSGNSSENDLNISVEITNSGLSNSGFINFATYPTNNQNSPLPDDVLSLNDFSADLIADRFWMIAPNYSSNPDFNITLQYTDIDITEFTTDSLNIIRYNNIDDTWSDLISVTTNTIGSSQASFLGSDVFKWFSLSSDYAPVANMIIPNGITPNSDNFNDTWIIEGCSNCEVYIYNRWGNKVYYSNNYDNSWDGGNSPSGAYYYVITTSDNMTYKGVVNIMR